jgi:hypothetical protein
VLESLFDAIEYRLAKRAPLLLQRKGAVERHKPILPCPFSALMIFEMCGVFPTIFRIGHRSAD